MIDGCCLCPKCGPQVALTLSHSVRIDDAVWTPSGYIVAGCEESKLVVWDAEGK